MSEHVIKCQKCGEHFSFRCQADYTGNVSCPHCENTTLFRDCDLMTMCPFCKLKLAIPAEYTDGTAMECPSCHQAFTYEAMGDDNESNVTPDTTITYSQQQLQQQPQNPPPPPGQLLSPGAVIGNYRIESLIGAGGMAEVYLATHVLLHQTYAIKVMKLAPGVDLALMAKRFIREAQLTMQVNHPNIVRVYDVGCDKGTGLPYIAMEFVQGQNLAEYTAGRQASEELLRHVALQMAYALDVIDHHGIVHRDIKPSNIIICNDGSLKLMDLGIARATEQNAAAQTQLTLEQSVLGTPAYASPEQCKSSHTVDIRSDIYSLGASLYHLATGHAPHGGTTAVEILLKVLQAEPAPLAQERPDLSHAIVELISSMMKKDPAERPQTPAQIIVRLQQPSVPLLTPPPATDNSKKIIAIGGGIAATLIVVLLGALIFLVSYGKQEPLQASSEATTATKPQVEKSAPSPTASNTPATEETPSPQTAPAEAKEPLPATAPAVPVQAIVATVPDAQPAVPAAQQPPQPATPAAAQQHTEQEPEMAPMAQPAPPTQQPITMAMAQQKMINYDIATMRSGFPQIKKAKSPFVLEEQLFIQPTLHNIYTPPRKASPDAIENFKKTNAYTHHKNVIDSQMYYAVASGSRHGRDPYRLYSLLELGYDINGFYPANPYVNMGNRDQNATATPIELLLMTELSAINNDLNRNTSGTQAQSSDLASFFKSYMILAENGADLNLSKQTRPPMELLLEICEKKPQPYLWLLIPYSLAHGAKIHTTQLYKIKDRDLREYVKKARTMHFLPPVIMEDMRLNTFAMEAAEMKEKPYPGEETVRCLFLFNQSTNRYGIGHNRPRLSVHDLRGIMAQGFNLNTLILCYESIHGGGTPKDYAEPGGLLAFLDFLIMPGIVGAQQKYSGEGLLFLLANGWHPVGAINNPSAFKFHFSPFLPEHRGHITLLWEFGMDVTARDLNIATSRDEYQFLYSLYIQQNCQFDFTDIQKEKFQAMMQRPME